MTNGHKILVVEDEGIIAHDIAQRLESLGHSVVATCGTAEEAVERAADADLVLMDIRLDGPIDGIAAATQIRERYRLPVIFLTGQADHATLERAKAADPFGYIVKPLAHATLQSSIEIALYKHRAERELQEREAWLRTIFISVADAVVVVDPAGRVVMLNRAAEILTGWTQPEAEGKRLDKIVRLIEERVAGEPTDPVALAILRDAPFPLGASWSLISRTGRQLMIEGAAAPVKAAGVTLGVALTLRDVSARRWEERQLRQAQKLEAMGRLAAGVANEYSTLLATIRHQSEQLLLQFSEYSPARKAAEQIQEAAAAAEQLNRRLAAFGTRQVSQPQVLSLNALLRRTTKLIESVIVPKVELSVRLDPATARITADPAQIERTVMTLVLHASACMPEGGRLLIETGNVEIPLPHTLLAITYTGAESDCEKLFEPASMEEGGLALSMVHAMVTEHGGYISAQSTTGGACRFEVLLPSWNNHALPAAVTPGEAPSILLVESREHVRMQLHNFFEANGYNLLEAADHGEALTLAQFHEGALDLLIADAVDADQLASDFKDVDVLRIVDGRESSEKELQRPFTQQALFERVDTLVRSKAAPQPA
ncbi:MAG TPA: response regulator [Bryobacteraceae bacterium]|nr:response regulator [Bryobacteraceae bacterium]